MPEKQLNMEMGNLICRFGPKLALLDMLDEIVLPAFFDNTRIRVYGQTSYFFYDVNLVKLPSLSKEPIIGIAGRFIKDTTVQREQIFEEGKGLIKDSETMRSSPSALFLLILNYHRLIYVKETRDAPPKETFRSTLLNFFMNIHRSFLKKVRRENRIQHKKNPEIPIVTSLELLEKYPPPTLELIPLTSEDSIEDFINKYNVLRSIEIVFSDRNSEFDNNPFFEQLQRRKDLLGSKKSIIRHGNAEGLNKDVAIEEVADATAQGNQMVKLDGLDAEGDILKGNNEKFQLRKSINELSTKPDEAAKQLYESFINLVQAGLIKLPNISAEGIENIRKLLSRFQ